MSYEDVLIRESTGEGMDWCDNEPRVFDGEDAEEWQRRSEEQGE